MKLKPCPFCGLTSDTDWEDTLYPSGVACVNLNRNFIGIEKDEEYFKIAKDRIESAKKTLE